MSEFLERKSDNSQTVEELTVQKAVVESLAADKVEQDEKIAELEQERNSLKNEVATLKDQLSQMRESLEKVGDVLAKNAESPESSKITLLERDVDIADRFIGETHDHILEIIKEARQKAEEEGRLRLAQILESVLVANTSSGNLQKKRDELKKLFSQNGNILAGPVICELEKMGIAYKHGEEYLLPDEIIKRTY